MFVMHSSSSSGGRAAILAGLLLESGSWGLKMVSLQGEVHDKRS